MTDLPNVPAAVDKAIDRLAGLDAPVDDGTPIAEHRRDLLEHYNSLSDEDKAAILRRSESQ